MHFAPILMAALCVLVITVTSVMDLFVTTSMSANPLMHAWITAPVQTPMETSGG